MSPIEQLRFFLSLGLDGQDWLDVEPFIESVVQQLSDSQNQVTLLRDELLWHQQHTYNPFEPDNQCDAHKRICKILAATEPTSIPADI
jgi:hypothetical protein